MLNIKGRGKKIELCFEGGESLSDAIEQLSKENSFLKGAEALVSYSNIELNYQEEMLFEKALKELLGEKIALEKKCQLSKDEIEYSLENDERLIRVVQRPLRSGEVIESRGDLIVYGDVNPGALLRAQGNITVIGAMRGAAHIMGEGKVYATYMKPSQIKIGNVCSYNKDSENVGSAIALAENGEIILECL